jgi:N-acetyl sugar amidotransferase
MPIDLVRHHVPGPSTEATMNKRLQCVRCLYSVLHPLGLVLDDEGVCSGCRIHEEKDTLDWDVRWNTLQDLVAPYKVESGRTYDCIVPVTGGNDSHFIVHTVKNRLGLNPLLVTYNKYFNTPLGIRNLANLRIKFNCDIVIQNVNPRAVRNVTRTTLRELGSMYWPCLAGQTVFPVQTAVRYKVPLIIWGAHQGLEQVGMFSHEHAVEMTRRYRKDHDLMGKEADDLLNIFDTLSEDDIWQYRYPDDADLQAVGVRGIYLGNYVRWDPKAQHEDMVRLHGYKGATFGRTFDTFDHVDCHNFMDVHDHIKYLKQGYSKVTDHASREIRHGRLTRDQALALVRHHETQPLAHLDKFCGWLGVDARALTFIFNQHRNPKVWQELAPGDWRRQPGCDFTQGDSPRSADSGFLGFRAHSTLNMDKPDAYVTVGKGYPL